MRFIQKRRGLTTACCGLLTLGGLTVLVAPHPAVAQSAEQGSKVNIDVVGEKLQTVLTILGRQANIETVVQEGDTPFKLINVHLSESSLPKALRTIALSANARVKRNEDGVYVFSQDSDTSSASNAAAQPAAAPAPVQNAANTQNSSNDNPELRFAPGDLHWQALVLQHAVPAEILKLMHWDKDLVEVNPFTALRMPEARPVISSTQPFNSSQTQQQQSPYPSYPSVPIGTGNAQNNGANYAHRSADPASPDQANQFPGGFGQGGFGQGGFGQGGFGQGGFQQGGFQQGGFQQGGFQQGQQGQPGGQQGGGALPTGVARIFALQSNNSLLIEATPEGYNQVKQIVKILDIAPRQVQIKVEFVTASVADVDNLGINFDLVPFPGLELASRQGDSTIVSGVAPTFLQYATGNVVAQLYQTLTRSRGKVVQAPLITTTNNVTASIEVNTQIPFFTTTVVNTGGNNNGTATGQQANFLQLQTGLTVTPRINSDDSVTLNLAPQITDTTGQSPVGGIPPTITQRVTTLRTVRSGDTMVLGGLVRKQETSSTQRIPLLSDIPFFGNLFRTRSKQTNDQELLIFVTPTIIGESNDSATANANGGQSVTVTP